jgi:hypothetical protein
LILFKVWVLSYEIDEVSWVISEVFPLKIEAYTDVD